MGLVWKNETWKILDLKSAEYNPRQLTVKQAKSLGESLERFALAEPVVINKNGTIIGGHQRISILKAKGVQEVDVRVPDRELAESEERELNLRLNRNLGEWDIDKLAEFDVDLLKDVGFDPKELDKVMGIQGGEDDFDVGAAVEAAKDPKTKTGDLWMLGEHRLLCGDATKKEDVERLMGGEKADMVFTDPPYGVSYASKNTYLNSISPGNRIQTPIENDHMDLENTSGFIFELFSQIKEILASRSSYYITAPQGGDLMMMMMMMMQKAGIPLRHCLIWVKNNHVLGRTDYNYKHEPILYGWVDVHDFYGGGKHRFSTWEINKPLKNDLHPTMKPVSLVENALLNSSLGGHVIADLCGGSGTTLIACEQLGRKCRMMEIDPKYCDVIVARWEKLTGKTAVLAGK